MRPLRIVESFFCQDVPLTQPPLQIHIWRFCTIGTVEAFSVLWVEFYKDQIFWAGRDHQQASEGTPSSNIRCERARRFHFSCQEIYETCRSSDPMPSAEAQVQIRSDAFSPCSNLKLNRAEGVPCGQADQAQARGGKGTGKVGHGGQVSQALSWALAMSSVHFAECGGCADL